MKIVPPPQEECVNVKTAYFKYTFKEPTALTGNQGFLPLKPVSFRTRKFQYIEYVIVTYNLNDYVIHHPGKPHVQISEGVGYRR